MMYQLYNIDVFSGDDILIQQSDSFELLLDLLKDTEWWQIYEEYFIYKCIDNVPVKSYAQSELVQLVLIHNDNKLNILNDKIQILIDKKRIRKQQIIDTYEKRYKPKQSKLKKRK